MAEDKSNAFPGTQIRQPGPDKCTFNGNNDIFSEGFNDTKKGLR
jgi:hypothetical protein